MLRLRLKKLKHRRYVIEELINTEKIHCKSLAVILKEVKIPAIENKLLNKEEANQIFSDLDEIQNLHQFFSSKLEIAYHRFDSRKSKIADVILKVLPMFKMYFMYCDNFKLANARLEKMRKENHKFISFIKTLEYTPTLQNLDLISQLVKPVQRLPKYVLLFKDLKKNTDEKHPDYQDISKCLDEFSKINEINNQKITDHLKKRRILELDKKFGTHDRPIVKEAREFISEEPLNILFEEMPRPAIGLFMTDLILISDVSETQVLKFIELDKFTILKDLPNSKYFKWLFSVSGKESVTVLSESLENKRKLMDFLNGNLKEIKEKVENRDRARISNQSSIGLEEPKNYHFILTVIGSLKRGIQHFRPVTMYIVQIQFGGILNRMYYRFSDMTKLNAIVSNEFPKVKIENLPKKHWFRAQKTKIIESRKLLIENFLNSIFFHLELRENIKILSFLSLAEKDETVFSEEFAIRNQKKNKSVYLDLLEKEKYLGKASILAYLMKTPEYSCFERRSFLFLSEFKGLEETRKIKVRLLNGESVTVGVKKYTKAVEVCFEIAQQLDLKSHLDFKLFLSNDEDERIVENEEFLSQVLDYDPEETLKSLQGKEREQENPVKNLWNKAKKNWNDMYFCKFVLIFKKYIFFPNDWEKRDIKKDPMKLNLVAAQIFYDTLHSKFKLSFDEYSLVAALRCYLEFGKIDPSIENDPHFYEKARVFIPSLIIYHKTKKFWWEKILTFWRKFTEEIESIHLLNTKYNASKSNKKKTKIENKQSIAHFSCFNFFKNIENFGEHLFWVTTKKSPDISIKIEKFLWMSLSYRSTSLLSSQEKKEILRMENEKISNVCSFPNSFSLIYDEKEFSFYSSASQEICNMIQENLNLNQHLKLLQRISSKKKE